MVNLIFAIYVRREGEMVVIDRDFFGNEISTVCQFGVRFKSFQFRRIREWYDGFSDFEQSFIQRDRSDMELIVLLGGSLYWLWPEDLCLIY